METKWIFLDLQIGLYYGGISSFFFLIYFYMVIWKSLHIAVTLEANFIFKV